MTRPPTARSRRWLLPVVYMAMIFVLSSQPNPAPEVTSRVWDKLLHAGTYAGLAFLFWRALTGEGLSWKAAALIAVLLSSAYGVSDEYHQYFVPTRDANALDWLADTIGAAFAAGICAMKASKA
jgi:VanZ family protein